MIVSDRWFRNSLQECKKKASRIFINPRSALNNLRKLVSEKFLVFNHFIFIHLCLLLPVCHISWSAACSFYFSLLLQAEAAQG